MPVVARFYVSGYERTSFDPDQTIVKMQAVTRGEHNKEWSKYTPNASLTMTIKNGPASAEFVRHLGDEFEVRFTPLPPQSAEDLRMEERAAGS